MYQLFQPIYRLPGGGSSCVLSAVDLSFLPLTSLSGIPELALQLFCPSEKSALKQFLRRGLGFFFCAF